MHNNQAYSVSLFCQSHGISRALYYKLAKEGKAPQTMQVGRRKLISREAAAEWRMKMEGRTSASA